MVNCRSLGWQVQATKTFLSAFQFNVKSILTFENVHVFVRSKFRLECMAASSEKVVNRLNSVVRPFLLVLMLRCHFIDTVMAWALKLLRR